MKIMVIAPKGVSQAALMGACSNALEINPLLVDDWKFIDSARLATDSKIAVGCILDFSPDRVIAFNSGKEDLARLCGLSNALPNVPLEFVNLDGDEFTFESVEFDDDDEPIFVYPSFQ